MASKAATIKAVVLGDVDDFKRGMDKVAASAEETGDKVKRDLSAGIDTLGEGAGGAEQKFIGLADSMNGFADVSEGLRTGNVVTLAMGMADLAGAVESLWAPLSKAVTQLWAKVTATAAEATATGTSTVALIGHKIATIASTAASKAQAAAQWALNAAMSANPILLVVIALAALVAGFIVAYKNVGWFRDIVDAVAKFFTDTLWPILQDVAGWLGSVFVAMWDAASVAIGWLIDKGQALYDIVATYVWPVLQTVAGWIGTYFVTQFNVAKGGVQFLIDAFQWLWDKVTPVFAVLATVADWVGTYFVKQFELAKGGVQLAIDIFQGLWDKAIEIKDGITSAFDGLVDFFVGLPGRIGDALSGMWDFVPSMPDITPGFDVPGVPGFAQGGLVRGGRGGVLGVIGEGQHDELVIPLDRAGGAAASGLGSTTVNVYVTAPVGSNPRDIGREIRRYLNEYDRAV